jgi:hypothetical protein
VVRLTRESSRSCKRRRNLIGSGKPSCDESCARHLVASLEAGTAY